MVLAMLSPWRWRSGKRTLELLQVCARCPVYNRRLRQCRPWPGSDLGCGCFLPYKVRFGGDCWLTSERPGLKMGW